LSETNRGENPDCSPIPKEGAMGRRARNEFPRPRFHKGTGQARVRVNGREIWLGRWASPEADAKYRALLQAWAASGGEEITAPAPAAATMTAAAATAASQPQLEQLTVGELLVRYLMVVKAERAVDRTHSKWWLARSVALALNSRQAVPLDQFGPRMLAEVQHELATGDMPKKRSGHTKRSRAQVAKTVNAIRAMFAWAVSQEMIQPDRLLALKTVPPLKPGLAREGDPREPVDDKLVDKTRKKLPPVVADMVEFMRRTGCRPTEAIRLRMADVEKLPGVWKWTLGRHKNAHRGKRRVIAIGPRAAAIAKRWATGKPADALVFDRSDMSRKPTGRSTIPIQLHRHPPAPFDAELIRKLVARACEAAEVPVWTPYQLRHTALTKARQLAGLEAAAAVGGHAASRMTEAYAKDDFDKAVTVAAKIG
jgi:integrase